MSEWSLEHANELNQYLDQRIDKLTKPIPSAQVLRIAEGIVTAHSENDDSVDHYTDEDYSNLVEAFSLLCDYIPGVLEKIRARSIRDDRGWRLHPIDAGQGDLGLCALCDDPFQHLGVSAQVHHLDMHPGAYHGVCRDCVREYAPLVFVEQPSVVSWLNATDGSENPGDLDRKDSQHCKAVVDAIRRVACADSVVYFSRITGKASEWAKKSNGEWR